MDTSKWKAYAHGNEWAYEKEPIIVKVPSVIKCPNCHCEFKVLPPESVWERPEYTLTVYNCSNCSQSFTVKTDKKE